LSTEPAAKWSFYQRLALRLLDLSEHIKMLMETLWRSSLQIEFFEDDLHSLAWQCPEVVGALANVALLIEKYGRGKASILGLGVCG